MKFTEGNIGRVFLLKFDHQDDFQAEITDFVKTQNIRAGHINFLGAIRKSTVVVGPKEAIVPPEAMLKTFDDGREVIGFGTIFWKGDEPKVHLHTMFSRGDDAFLGCIREKAEVFLVIEAVVTELVGVNVVRELDETSQLVMMSIKGARK